MKRPPVLWLLLLAPLVVLLCLSTGASGLGFPSTATETGRAILMLRWSRVLAGLAVGAGLACAGAVLQAMLRNPLAEPYVLGVSSGAAVGAALAILSGVAVRFAFVLPVSAFVCSGLTLLLVYTLASARGRMSIYGLILSGVIVSAMCNSFLMFMISVAPAQGLHSVTWWMLGDLQASNRTVLYLCAALILIAGGVLWGLAREFNALSLGQEMAHHVGIRTRRAMTLGLLMASLMTASAVALAGIIGFVGLIVPHVLRSWLGPDHRRLIPVSMLAGGLFLILCDAVARSVLALLQVGPVEVPVGVVTALLGGPFFLVVLYRRRQGWVE